MRPMPSTSRRPAGKATRKPAGPATGSDTRAPAPANPTTVLALAVLVAAIGGVVVFLVGNLDVGAGLLALSAAVGWTTGLALAEGRRGRGGYPPGRTRIVLAAGLAAAAVALAFLALGVLAILEGGVLSPIDYLTNRFGPIVLLDIVVAGVVGAARAR